MPTYTSGGSPYLANVPFKVNKRTGSGTFTVTTGTGGTNNSSVHNKYVYHHQSLEWYHFLIDVLYTSILLVKTLK